MSRKRQGAGTWLLAFAIFGLCLGLRLLLAPWLAPMKFLTFYPGVAASTLLFGWPQGFLVLVLSTISAWYFFFEPAYSFQTTEANTIATLVGFVFVSGFILALVAAMRDLVQRLERARVQQEDLFRELQHRVANNLQIAVVLLRNARRRTHDDEAVEAINQAEERIDAMSRLHRRLHDGSAFADDLQSVMEDVLAENLSGLPVEAKIEMEANAGLSLDQTTALILLVNEAAMNAVKHVFHKGLGRRFEVSLRRREEGRLLLVVGDDGPGIAPQAVSAGRRVSLGMNIMEALSRQLGGPLQMAGEPGETLRVEFAPAGREEDAPHAAADPA